jgi:hypothetical protein
LVFLTSGCNTSLNTTSQSISNKSIEAISENEKLLYHQFFGLSEVQKNELKIRGYNDNVIASIYNEDLKALEGNWKLTDQQVLQAKSIYPELLSFQLQNGTP